MTADIINFPKKPSPKPKVAEITLPTRLEVFMYALDTVTHGWQRAVETDKLNEFFEDQLPAETRCALEEPFYDYTSDLNVLSEIEQHLKIKVLMFYPGCTENNEHGWIAGFHHDTYEDGSTEVYTTPSLMVAEGPARAMNILLYLEFHRQLATLK